MICLIFNPAARGEQARRLRQWLETLRGECELTPTSAPGDARHLAAKALERGAQLIVAAGGDGTMNEVLNGFGDVPNGFERAALGVMPVGTANVFAKELGMPSDHKKAWDIIRQKRETRIDLLCAEFAAQGGVQHRYFVELAGAGLDARAVELVSWNLKKRSAYAAYFLAAVKAWLRTNYSIRANIDGQIHTGELVLIGNGKLYGGNFKFFPEANLDDGKIHLCIYSKITIRTLVLLVLSIVFKQARSNCDAHYFKATTLSLESNTPVPMELDGEAVGHLPAKVTIKPGGLRIIVP